MFKTCSYEPISDIGGKRILNMGGSLLGYINTGNPYHKDYFCPENNSLKKSEPPKKKSHKKAFIGFLAGVAALGAGIFLFKKGKFKGALSKLKSFYENIKNKIHFKKPNVNNAAKTAKNAADAAANGTPKLIPSDIIDITD